MFAVEHICFSYQDRTVLDDLSTVFARGMFYGIIGPNGCGKSTFLDLLSGHRRPDHGSIQYQGRPLPQYTKKSLAQEIALVPQNFYINFPFSVHEIVMMGRYPHLPRFAAPGRLDFETVDQVMEKTGILDFKNRFITELSGGERQRVVFARALAQSAEVLILDEATSNLDINHGMRLLHIAREGVKKEGKTVIAVLQDINQAAHFCDALVFMKHGGIVAAGPVESTLTEENIKKVFQIASKVYFEPYTGVMQAAFRTD